MAQFKQVVLSWDDVPEMAPSIKQAVELSIWTMFEVASGIERVKYLLDTTERRYLLESSGSILKVVEDTDVFEIQERVFFEGFVMTTDRL